LPGADRRGADDRPTPPPDIDLPAWRASIELIEQWRPRALALTHFGVHEGFAAQLADLRRYLDEIESLAERFDAAGFARELAARSETARSGSYLQATPPEQSYNGSPATSSASAGPPKRVSRMID